MYPNKQKKKYHYNFFLTEEEKNLIFTLKHLHRLNNRLGNSKEEYSNFIEEMTCFYKNILVQYSHHNLYAEKNKNQQKSHCPDERGKDCYDSQESYNQG